MPWAIPLFIFTPIVATAVRVIVTGLTVITVAAVFAVNAMPLTIAFSLVMMAALLGLSFLLGDFSSDLFMQVGGAGAAL